MLDIVICIGMTLAYLILYYAFGTLVTRQMKGEASSVTLTTLIGYFLYYAVFQVVAIPMALLKRPLSNLSLAWVIILIMILIFSIWNRRQWMKTARELTRGFRSSSLFWIMIVIVLLQIGATTIWQTDFWDAAYYVGDVSLSVHTNTISHYDPLSRELRDVIDIRHFFAMYHMQDAVMCQLTGIHPLVETKTIMAAVVMIITNMIYYRIARLFFKDNHAVVWFMFFAFVVNLFSYTMYTTSGFLFLRTYEGKTILGNVIIPALLYFFARLYQDAKYRMNWVLLFLVGYGGCAISSSSMILVMVGIGAFSIPLVWLKKDWKILVKSAVCAVPCLLVTFCYLLSRMGILVIHI